MSIYYFCNIIFKSQYVRHQHTDLIFDSIAKQKDSKRVPAVHSRQGHLIFSFWFDFYEARNFQLFNYWSITTNSIYKFPCFVTIRYQKSIKEYCQCSDLNVKYHTTLLNWDPRHAIIVTTTSQFICFSCDRTFMVTPYKMYQQRSVLLANIL